MKIDKATLEKIAHLARIELDEKEAEQLIKDLSAVLDWMEKLNEVDTEGVEPLTTMSQEINVFRKDEVQNHLDHDSALNSAPQKDENYFRVLKVLE